MQFDADEDGEPFFKPPIVSPAPLGPQDEQHATKQQFPESAINESGSSQEAAAIATVEQDEWGEV